MSTSPTNVAGTAERPKFLSNGMCADLEAASEGWIQRDENLLLCFEGGIHDEWFGEAWSSVYNESLDEDRAYRAGRQATLAAWPPRPVVRLILDRADLLKEQGEGILAIAQHLADVHGEFSRAFNLHQDRYMPLAAERIRLEMGR